MSEDKKDDGNDVGTVASLPAIDALLLKRIIFGATILGAFVGGTIKGCAEEFKATPVAVDQQHNNGEVLAQGQARLRQRVKYNEDSISANKDIMRSRDKATTLGFQSLNDQSKRGKREIEILKGKYSGLDESLEALMARIPPR